MSKNLEYQRFVAMMRDLTDRPCFLQPMFARGMSYEQVRDELASFKRNGERMFKAAAHGRLDRATSKNRIMTLQAMERLAARGALDALRSAYGRRMTPEARAWRTITMDNLERGLRRVEEVLGVGREK